MAERLTVSGATTQRDIDRLMELSNDNQFGRNEAYYKLQHYEDLEEQGRLIELPCAVGDTVWFYSEALEEVCKGKVIGFVLNIYTTPRLWIEVEYTSRLIGEQTFKDREDFMLGKKIFLTREEAEAALKGAEHDNL